MAINYKWVVDNLDVIPEQDGVKDVVNRVYWRLIGTEVQDEITKHNSVFGATELQYVQGIPYTEYQNLTEAQVVDWVKGVLGPERVQANEQHVADILAAMRPQQSPNLPLPWK